MLRLRSDLLQPCSPPAMAELADIDLRWSDVHSLVVVMAARGYPGAYRKGATIRGLDRAAAVPRAQVFHAGTARAPKTARCWRSAGACSASAARGRRCGRRATPPTRPSRP